MSAFRDLAVSLQMRDAIQRMVASSVDTLRPKYRYATVESIDRLNRKCSVIFNGETGAVQVNMGSVQPAEVGQVVRIEGYHGDRFVADVLGPTIYLPLDGGTMSGEIDMGSNAIRNLASPTTNPDAANKQYVDSGDIGVKSYVDQQNAAYALQTKIVYARAGGGGNVTTSWSGLSADVGTTFAKSRGAGTGILATAYTGVYNDSGFGSWELGVYDANVFTVVAGGFGIENPAIGSRIMHANASAATRAYQIVKRRVNTAGTVYDGRDGLSLNILVLQEVWL